MKQLTFLVLAIMLTAISCGHCDDSEDSQKTDQKKFSGRLITLRDFGADDLGFLSLPKAAPKCGVLIIHGEMGLNDAVKNFCDHVATHGQVGLAIDLYNGQVPIDKSQAQILERNLRPESALKTIQAGLNLLLESPQWRSDHAVIVVFGQQANLSLDAIRQYHKEIAGMTWFEPKGMIEEKLILKSNIPLQIIVSKNDETHFLSNLNLDKIPERKKLVYLETFNETEGFSITSSKALGAALKFWIDCSAGKYQKDRNFFQRWLDTLTN
jgi:carboxymethylenebutenolidase